MKKAVRTVVYFLALLFAIAVGKVIGHGAFDSVISTGNITDALIEGNRRAVNEMTPRLPIRLDEITVLNGVEANGTEVIYHYILEVDPNEVSAADLKELVQPGTTKSVCSTHAMTKSMAAGGKYTYSYTTEGDDFIGIFSTVSADCK